MRWIHKSVSTSSEWTSGCHKDVRHNHKASPGETQLTVSTRWLCRLGCAPVQCIRYVARESNASSDEILRALPIVTEYGGAPAFGFFRMRITSPELKAWPVHANLMKDLASSLSNNECIRHDLHTNVSFHFTSWPNSNVLCYRNIDVHVLNTMLKSRLASATFEDVMGEFVIIILNQANHRPLV
jgi:hypothetical protein